MHLVDDIHFIFSFRRTIRHLFPNLTDIVNTIVRSSIYLDHIHRSTGTDCFTAVAHTTGASIYRMLTVYRLCKYLRNRCLTGPPRSTKEIRMSDSVCFYLILQCLADMILPFYILKFPRAKFSIQSSIRHLQLPFFLFVYLSPKLIPVSFASLMILESGSTIFNFPATSDSGTFTVSPFFIPTM